jgi:hypothetical protein
LISKSLFISSGVSISYLSSFQCLFLDLFWDIVTWLFFEVSRSL